MDIEIRRNRDISCSVTCENPEALKELFQMTEEQKRLQEEYEARRKEVEDEFWRFVKEHPTRDCNGEVIKPETHEIGFDFGEPDDDGMMEAKTMWVRPKKSEYEEMKRTFWYYFRWCIWAFFAIVCVLLIAFALYKDDKDCLLWGLVSCILMKTTYALNTKIDEI